MYYNQNIKKKDSSDGATVSLFFVDVVDIEKSMEELLSRLRIYLASN